LGGEGDSSRPDDEVLDVVTQFPVAELVTENSNHLVLVHLLDQRVKEYHPLVFKEAIKVRFSKAKRVVERKFFGKDSGAKPFEWLLRFEPSITKSLLSGKPVFCANSSIFCFSDPSLRGSTLLNRGWISVGYIATINIWKAGLKGEGECKAAGRQGSSHTKHKHPRINVEQLASPPDGVEECGYDNSANDNSQQNALQQIREKEPVSLLVESMLKKEPNRGESIQVTEKHRAGQRKEGEPFPQQQRWSRG